MATINLGKVKVTPEGLYDSSKSYSELSLVGYEGSSYISIKDVPAGTLPTNTAYWQLHGSKGADGTNGQNGADGADAINPFKGWYDTSATLGTAFPTPAVGDYAYVAGATTSDPVTIYRCTTAGTWTDSGRTFNPSNNQEFASGESLNTVRIVNNLNGGSTNVLSAEQGKVLDQKVAALGPKIDQLPHSDEGSGEGDLDITDEVGYTIARFQNGHVKTKNFDSEAVPQVGDGGEGVDLDVNDENGNTIVRFYNGHVKTKNFDSSKIGGSSSGDSISLSLEGTNTIKTAGINEPFFIEVTDDYRVYSASLYAIDGSEVNDNFLAPDDGHNFAFRDWTYRKFYSTMNISKDSYLVVKIRRADGNDIGATELKGVVKRFGLFSRKPFVSTLESMPIGYKIAAKRTRQFMHVVWTPLAKIASDTEHIGSNTSDYYLAGKRQIGLPYSSVKECWRYVGLNVSFYTFLTAIKNKRSLLYTENTDSSKSRSSYGYTYHGVNCSCYFGAVCNTMVNYTIGTKYLYDSSDIVGITGMAEISNPTTADLQVMDLVWYSGHISILYDIIKDEYGNVLFLVWAEMNIPCGRLTPYTPELFWERMQRKSGKIYRWSKIGENTVINEHEIVPTEDYMLAYNTNNELRICTFLGDKAVFVTGEDIYLNVVKGECDAIKLYKDGSLIQTIDISSTTVDSDGYVVLDSKPGINITSYCQNNGSFEAILVSGSTDVASTTFKVYNISLSLSGSSGNATLTFSVPSDCTPISIERVMVNGAGASNKNLTETDVANGYVNVTWQFSASYYARLFVKVPSGEIVTKKIIFNI